MFPGIKAFRGIVCTGCAPRDRFIPLPKISDHALQYCRFTLGQVLGFSRILVQIKQLPRPTVDAIAD
jgi:hypothetical protein